MPTRARAPGQPTTLRCTRCGYDLSGAARAAGLTSSPAPAVTGDTAARTICPECGFESLWADVLDPTRNNIPWLYEHTPRRRLDSMRAWRTLIRTILLWRFWGAVTLASRVSIVRLLLWLPVLIIPLHVLWAGLSTARRLVSIQSGGTRLTQLTAAEWTDLLRSSWAYPIVVREWTLPGWSWRLAQPESSFLLPLGPTLLAPLILLLLTRSRATCKVRPGHILRAGIYGAGWIVGWYALWTVFTLGAVLAEWVFGLSGTSVWNPVLVTPRGSIPLSLTPLLVTPCLLWFALWWRWAIVRFMKLPRGGLIWWLVMTASLLLGVNLSLLDDQFMQQLLGWLSS